MFELIVMLCFLGCIVSWLHSMLEQNRCSLWRVKVLDPGMRDSRKDRSRNSYENVVFKIRQSREMREYTYHRVRLSDNLELGPGEAEWFVFDSRLMGGVASVATVCAIVRDGKVEFSPKAVRRLLEVEFNGCGALIMSFILAVAAMVLLGVRTYGMEDSWLYLGPLTMAWAAVWYWTVVYRKRCIVGNIVQLLETRFPDADFEGKRLK